MANDTGNGTVSEYFIPYYFDPLNWLLKAVGLTSSVVGLIGNAVVLTLIFGSNKFRRPANIFVANLSLTSTVYILVTNLRFWAGRPQDPLNEYVFFCLLTAFLGKFTHALIAFTTMGIVLDRNYRVKHPMSIPSKQWLLKVVLLIWLFSAILTVPRAFMYHLQTFPEDVTRKCIKTILWDSEDYQIAYLLVYFSLVTVLPIGTSAFGMVEILKVIHGLSSCRQAEGSSKDIRFRILRNTFIFSVVFILGWGPSGIIMFLTDFPPNRMPWVISQNFKLFKYFNIVGFVQNSLNPVLLFLLSSDLRQYMYRTKERFCRP